MSVSNNFFEGAQNISEGTRRRGDLILPEILTAIQTVDIAQSALIATNIADIATNAGLIATNITDIGTNVTAIGLNTVAVAASVDGLNVLKCARATVDATGTLAVGDNGLGVTLPDNAIIVDAVLDIVTAFVSAGGNGTLALNSEGAGDLLAAVDADTLANIVAMVPVGSAATMIKMTAARELTATVAVEDLTSGVAVLFVYYVISQ